MYSIISLRRPPSVLNIRISCRSSHFRGSYILCYVNTAILHMNSPTSGDAPIPTIEVKSSIRLRLCVPHASITKSASEHLHYKTKETNISSTIRILRKNLVFCRFYLNLTNFGTVSLESK